MEETNKTEESENLAKAKIELEGILLKYKVVLLPVVMHQGDKTFSRIDIVPISKVEESQSKASN
jgi:hypothetical protein